ncbi:sigma54 specific transcriptional regulator, Fis family [Clostridium carboxidivorans P7]|uniref:Sigma54 specific transcriptional regulator, Fis family n=2 Tax=Clostridium TaxID=1485 RepID=C6PY15_9CLOT|nr:sigma54 specific transcriptional regulator, Fis family [Clostridium carboxidivorans P7]
MEWVIKNKLRGVDEVISDMRKFNKDEQKKIILESHKRCEALGIKKNRVLSRKIITSQELQKKLKQNKELVVNTSLFMNGMCDFTKNTKCLWILTDMEGCILNVIGDEDILREAFKLKVFPGAYMNEQSIGTNAMSIALMNNLPVQVSGEDHFLNSYHRWTCSAAPIRNGIGEIIGVLDLTGYSECVNSHTLGMVVASANAIEKILEFKNYNAIKKERKLAKRLLNNQAIYTFDKIIGKSKKITNAVEYAKKISDSNSTILITGESGTGKEIFAQAIHNYSQRKDMPFIAINCGALPSNLIELELFGYEDGAFTGAKKGGNAGKFEMAEGGTIFLDEIGEMPLDMQVSLLRVMEEGVINRIGGCKQILLNVRIIAATNKDLKEEVSKGRFRKDLFYRLNVLPLHVPSLRDRKEDVPLLVEYYMKKASKRLNKRIVDIDENSMENLKQYEWTGNVRELENVIELTVNTEKLPEEFCYSKVYEINIENTVFKQNTQIGNMNLELLEKNHIINVLHNFKGNITLAAKVMGIGRNTLYRKIQKYHIMCSEIENYIVLKR